MRQLPFGGCTFPVFSDITPKVLPKHPLPPVAAAPPSSHTPTGKVCQEEFLGLWGFFVCLFFLSIITIAQLELL